MMDIHSTVHSPVHRSSLSQLLTHSTVEALESTTSSEGQKPEGMSRPSEHCVRELGQSRGGLTEPLSVVYYREMRDRPCVHNTEDIVFACTECMLIDSLRHARLALRRK